jgi:hypothetical protein
MFGGQLSLFYKGRRLKAPYRADFVCYEEITVELKAFDQIQRDRMGAGPELPQSEWPRKRSLDQFWSKEFRA